LFNVALGLAFLISIMASPGGKLLSMVFEQDAFRTMPPYQGVVASVIANYWLPTILLYLALRILRADRYLLPGVIGHLLFGVPNAVLCLYVGLRVFTSTVQGGGATFALASMGAPFIQGSIYVLDVAVLWLAVRSVWFGIRRQPLDAHAKEPKFRTPGLVVAAVMIVPAAGILAWLYATNAEKIGKAADARRAKAARFNELCQTATRIEIYRRVNDAQSVLFPLSTNAAYPLLEKLAFVEVKRGWAQPDKPPYERLSKKPGEPVFIQGRANIERTEIAEPEAQYEISARPIESKSDAAMSLYIVETMIRERRTNEVLAVFTAIGERKTVVRGDEPFCPKGFEDGRYQAEVPSYVLGLMDDKTSKNFEARLAALKSKTADSQK
jgi:hypothetical protein